MADDSMLRTPIAKPAAAKSHPDSWEPELAELRQRQALARQMGGPERVERQHKGGRLTVRERIDRMLDPGTFKEIGSIAGRRPTTPRVISPNSCRVIASSGAARWTGGRW